MPGVHFRETAAESRADACDRGPDQYTLLKGTISEEPMGPVVRQGDEEWFTLVRWIPFTLIHAEAAGYTQANIRARTEDPKGFYGSERKSCPTRPWERCSPIGRTSPCRCSLP